MSKRDLFLGGEFLIKDIEGEDVFTPEDFSEEHRLIRETASEFVRNEIEPNVDAIEKKDNDVIIDVLQKAGEIGLNATDFAEEYDGLGLDKISTAIVAEILGAAGSFSVVHAVHTGIEYLPLVYFGNHDQKSRYLPGIAAGTLRGAYCLTEAGAGSDALNAKTKAILSEDGKNYVLNGEKVFITNAGIAQLFIVYAKVDGEKFTCFLVDADTPGVSTGREEEKMGMRGTSTRSVILEDASVPIENVLFEVGQGHKIAFNVLNLGRWKLGAAVVGSCKKCIRESAVYANARSQFGKSISSFGLIKGKLADMAIRTYVGESMMYRVAGMVDDRIASLDEADKKKGEANAKAIGEYAVECSISKIYGSEMLDFCVDETVQVHGGYGYVAEYGAERYYRDSRINRIWEGTNEINRMLIPGTLLRRAMTGRLPLLGAATSVTEDVLSYSPLSVELEDTPLAQADHMMKMAKKIALVAAGTPAMTFGDKIADEQEVLYLVANIIIEVFAMESALLRAQKTIAAAGEEKAATQIAACQVYVDETIPRIERWARQVLAYTSEGDDLRTQLAGVKKLARTNPIDTFTLRRKIADEIIDREAYAF